MSTSGTPDRVLPCANSSSVQGSLIELAIVQATSYCELWDIPLKPVYLEQLALGWPEKRNGKVLTGRVDCGKDLLMI